MFDEEYEKEEYLKRLVGRAGMKFFTDNYFSFRNGEKIDRTSISKERISAMNTIFSEKLNIEALRLIASSFSKSGEKARAIYFLETDKKL